MKRTQCDMILRYLKRGRAITPIDALRRWGCFRLAARIADLKRDGYGINRMMAEEGGKRFAIYWLIK